MAKSSSFTSPSSKIKVSLTILASSLLLASCGGGSSGGGGGGYAPTNSQEAAFHEKERKENQGHNPTNVHYSVVKSIIQLAENNDNPDATSKPSTIKPVVNSPVFFTNPIRYPDENPPRIDRVNSEGLLTGRLDSFFLANVNKEYANINILTDIDDTDVDFIKNNENIKVHRNNVREAESAFGTEFFFGSYLGAIYDPQLELNKSVAEDTVQGLLQNGGGIELSYLNYSHTDKDGYGYKKFGGVSTNAPFKSYILLNPKAADNSLSFDSQGDEVNYTEACNNNSACKTALDKHKFNNESDNLAYALASSGVNNSYKELYKKLERDIRTNDFLYIESAGSDDLATDPVNIHTLGAFKEEFKDLTDRYLLVAAKDLDDGDVSSLLTYNRCGELLKDQCLVANYRIKYKGENITGIDEKEDGSIELIKEPAIQTNVQAKNAAAYVAGAAAMVKSKYPFLGASEIQQILLTTAKDLGDTGVDPIYGWGLVQPQDAVYGPKQILRDFNIDTSKVFEGLKGKDLEAAIDRTKDVNYTFLNNISGGHGTSINIKAQYGSISFEGDNSEYQGTVNIQKGSVSSEFGFKKATVNIGEDAQFLVASGEFKNLNVNGRFAKDLALYRTSLFFLGNALETPDEYGPDAPKKYKTIEEIKAAAKDSESPLVAKTLDVDNNANTPYKSKYKSHQESYLGFKLIDNYSNTNVYKAELIVVNQNLTQGKTGVLQLAPGIPLVVRGDAVLNGTIQTSAPLTLLESEGYFYSPLIFASSFSGNFTYQADPYIAEQYLLKDQGYTILDRVFSTDGYKVMIVQYTKPELNSGVVNKLTSYSAENQVAQFGLANYNRLQGLTMIKKALPVAKKVEIKDTLLALSGSEYSKAFRNNQALTAFNATNLFAESKNKAGLNTSFSTSYALGADLFNSSYNSLTLSYGKDNFQLATALNYGDSSWENPLSLGRSSSKALGVTLAGGLTFNKTSNLALALDYNHHSNQVRRELRLLGDSFNQTSKVVNNSLDLSLRYAYDLRSGNTTISPYLLVAYQRNALSAFSEDYSSLNTANAFANTRLDGSKKAYNFFRPEAGVLLSSKVGNDLEFKASFLYTHLAKGQLDAYLVEGNKQQEQAFQYKADHFFSSRLALVKSFNDISLKVEGKVSKLSQAKGYDKALEAKVSYTF